MPKANALTPLGLRIQKLVDTARERTKPATALDCPSAAASTHSIRELADAFELMLAAMAPPPGGEDNPFWEKVDATRMAGRMTDRWHVVRSRKKIVSGPSGVSVAEAHAFVARWNTLFQGADYEAISGEEAKRRHARPVNEADAKDP